MTLVVVIFGILLAWLFMISQPTGATLGSDSFAKCLAEKGVVMYGAYWCPHCQNQKKLFGNSFKNIKYVECTQETKLCAEKKITSYPTWEFMDGSRQEGEMNLGQLAEKTSCEIPK